MRRMKYSLAVAAVAATLLAAPALAQTVPPPAISVSGEATVSVAPDQAQIDGGANISYALGFNEPDGTHSTGGSALPVDLAAARWKAEMEPLKKLGVKVGAPAVTGFNSAACGSCWNLTFTNGQGKSTSITITAIDVATPDFNIGLTAMNELTGNQAVQIGRAPITAAQIAASNCGL